MAVTHKGKHHYSKTTWGSQLTNVDSTSRRDAEYGFQEGRCIGAKDTDPLVTTFHEVIRKSSSPIRDFLIRSTYDLTIY